MVSAAFMCGRLSTGHPKRASSMPSCWVCRSRNRHCVRGQVILFAISIRQESRLVKMSEQKVVVQPLQGKRILVTRTREQAGTLSTRLQALGAVPIEFPTIRIVPPSDWTQFDGALHRFYGSGSPAEQGHAYDWLIFTSVNGVHIWLDRAQALGYDSSALAGVRVATIGPATAAALAHGGIVADLIPGE